MKGKNLSILLSAPEELGIGFLAGVASRAISTPLSVITVRLQTETEGEDEEGELDAEKSEEVQIERRPRGVIPTVKRIYEEEGLKEFWSGKRTSNRHTSHSHLLPGFTITIPLSFNPSITLFLFQVFRKFVSLHGPHHPKSRSQKMGTPSARTAFFGAAISNAIAIALLYPLILAKTRLQAHRKNGEAHESMISVWRKALQREGVQGLYQGLDAQVVKGFVSQGITMMVKQRYVQILLDAYFH